MKFSLNKELERRVLVLDGAMGTMLDCPPPADALVLSEPETIARVHEAYLAAGADIISTDTFNANPVSLADYGLQDKAYEINLAAAKIARAEADKLTLRNPSKPRFIAGSMGPTSRMSSRGDITFTELSDAYFTQARGLVDGGADILLIETIFDTLNAKAALFAIAKLREKRGAKIPVMLSGTIANDEGRNLSGQTIEAFYTSLKHGGGGLAGDLLSVGLNCAFGARQLQPYLERLAKIAECRVSAHPNAGLPNVEGGYDETPEMFAADIEKYLQKGLVNIVGGCCGTTPEHIRRVAQVVEKYNGAGGSTSGGAHPRPLPAPRHKTVLCGTDTLEIDRFTSVGERANVAGSAKFARLVREENWDEAIAVAREQIPLGAEIVDVCMDDGMVDGPRAMTRFLTLAAADPELAKAPVMLDSSDWNVLTAGLRCTQGKSVVNSISLKNGEREFLERAREVQNFGAAVVVMLFDERGQADTFERKTEVAERAYKLLTDNCFPPEDIIFDPNVMAIETPDVMAAQPAVDFIEATRWIKQNLPHTHVVAGVSNLSFAFRGNNAVREAMHAVFLHHAREAGLDMALVNVATALDSGEIKKALTTKISIPDAVKQTQKPAPPTGIKVLMATVWGDIHDIGKKIAAAVMATAGHEVIDLGVTVGAEKIVDEAVRNNVNAIGLSGLITPSLDEMVRVVRELERRGLKIPVIIGGATTSKLHTALKIAPEYSGAVIHARDAEEGLGILAELTAAQNLISPEDAYLNAYVKPAENIAIPIHTGRIVFSDFPIENVERYINWTMFFAAWEARGKVEKEQLKADAEELMERIKLGKLLRLEGVAGVFPARRGDESKADTIIITGSKGDDIELPQPRNRRAGKTANLSVADYVTNAAQDYIGAFALTAGVGLKELAEMFQKQGDDYRAIMSKFLADRLTEAFAEAVHEIIKREIWGFESKGLRYAFGYPAVPDHGQKREVFRLLGVEQTTSMRLTDNNMIEPGEALCGLMVADPNAQYFAVEN